MQEESRELESAIILLNKISNFLPNIREGVFSHIERKYHIWDWCDEKDLSIKDFCDLLALRAIEIASKDRSLEIFVSNKMVRIRDCKTNSIGIGDSMLSALLDFFENTNSEINNIDVKNTKEIKELVFSIKSSSS